MLRLLRTTALRHALVYFIVFALAAAIAVIYIFWRTNVLLAVKQETAVQSEIQAFDEQYRTGGIDQLRRAIALRSESPGNSLYLVTNAEGHWLAGNLKEISPDLWNSKGRVVFMYRRPAISGGAEERLAFAQVIRLVNGYRLIVGRDIEDQRTFKRIIRTAFLWTLAGMVLLGMGVSILMNRHLLRRLAAITETSRNIMAGDLSQRVKLTGSGDEFDELSASLNAMLQRIVELIDGFKEVSDNIAHDLKTPLNRLRNRIETTLREARGEEAYREALTAAIEDADNLIKTFDALLSIARLEAGAASNRGRTQFDLSAMVTDVCELYEPVAEERGLELRQSHASEIMVAGEQQLLAQAIANVVDNAIKYASPDFGGDAMHADNARTNGAGPHITVSLETRGGQAEISVADTGPGIPAADRERALKRFVRLEASRSRPGSGLGLSLVAAVMRLHGGDVTLADNQPGLKVILKLPTL
ncbi:MAG: ATP-binding protein [Alphaproteobacteria bacterium]